MGGTQDGAALPPAPDTGASDRGPNPSGATTTPFAASSGPGLPGVGGPDGFGGFGKTFLTEPVGRGQANNPDDVHRASRFLADNGILPGPTRDADEGFLRGIEKGQERLNDLAGGGLRVDGIAKPWGPTEMLSQRAVTAGKMKASEPAPPQPANQPHMPRLIAPTRLASGKPSSAGHAARPKLPPPHTTIDGRAAANRPDEEMAGGQEPIPSFHDKIGELVDLLAKRRVEMEIPVGADGKPDDRNAVDIHKDAMERMTRVIDNLISIFTRLRAPTVVTPTLEDPFGPKGGA